MVRIAVFVSGGGTNLQSLIDSVGRKEINGEIVLVISNRKSAYGLERAKMANIDTFVSKDEDEILNKLEEKNVELIVLAGYLAIISEKLISRYENKIINIHPSLIPSFCGPGFYGHYVHDAVYKRGVKVSGATVHFVTSEVDGGPIIAQKAIDISSATSPDEIASMVLTNVEHKLLPEAVKLYCDGKIQVINGRVEIL